MSVPVTVVASGPQPAMNWAKEQGIERHNIRLATRREHIMGLHDTYFVFLNQPELRPGEFEMMMNYLNTHNTELSTDINDWPIDAFPWQ